MEFEFGWQGPAAEARVVAARGFTEVAERESDTGRELVIRGHAYTEGVAALLWRMKDRVESAVDAKTLLVKRYVLEQRENQYHCKTVITFAPDGRSADTVKTRYDKPADDPKRTSQGTWPCYARLDAASLAYYLRAFSGAPGQDELTAVFFDGRHSFRIHVIPLAQERIRVKAGEFDAYRCEVRFSDIDREPKPGQESKVQRAVVWVSAGPERLPLKLESETFVGKVFGELAGRWAPEPEPGGS